MFEGRDQITNNLPQEKAAAKFDGKFNNALPTNVSHIPPD
jgi:hypothetical protein